MIGEAGSTVLDHFWRTQWAHLTRSSPGHLGLELGVSYPWASLAVRRGRLHAYIRSKNAM